MMKRFQRISALVVAVLLIAGMVLTGCGGSKEKEPSSGDATQTEKPYAGTTIRFLAAVHPWTDTIEAEIPKFEEATGINVEMEVLAENQLTQKLTVELAAGTGTVDVFAQRPLQEAKLFAKNGWYADLYQFINDPAKTPADYDINDFFPGTLAVETIDGKLCGIPLVTEQQIIYYRKDLFEEKGIKVPTTMEELEAAAAALNDPANDFYGIVMRGQGNPAVTQFSSFLYSFGGDFIVDGKFAMDTPEAIAAAEFYGKLLNKYGPPGVLNMHWMQAAGLMAQGKAAMWVDANSLYLNVTDPANSQVGDKIGFAMFPAGPAGSLPYNVTSWGLSIAESSKNKDAAWEFVKWATSKEMVLKTQAAGNPGARASVWDNPEGTKAWPEEWVEVAKKSAAIGKSTDRPLVINVGQARDIIGEILTAAISGEDITELAKAKNAELNKLLEEESK